MAKCSGDLPSRYWQDGPLLRAELEAHGSLSAVSRAHGGAPSTLAFWWASKHGYEKLPEGHPTVGPSPTKSEVEGDLWLLKVLKRVGNRATVEELADKADKSPRRIREAISRLSAAGYRLDIGEEAIRLITVAPDHHNLHRGLLEGETVRVGVVSDTHLGSNEEALEELHLAYDWFESEGVDKVMHAGDWITGRGIFRGQDSEIKLHTLDAQIEYLTEKYPKRKGVQTFGISGNHDLEGEAGRVGLDPIYPFAHRRDDITYLGAYSAWLQVGGDNGPWIHLLHGRGGMSYAYSYKAQKLTEGYPVGRKPAVLICGHWHVRGSFETRGIQVIFPGCFEWQSRFLQRLGLLPSVGFHTLEMTFGDDGSLVQFLPRWFKFYEGRVIG